MLRWYLILSDFGPMWYVLIEIVGLGDVDIWLTLAEESFYV